MLSEKSALEYKAVREGVGWYRLTLEESAFEMFGKDTVSFLHGMVSNDIKSLKEGSGCYAACLTSTGKVLSDLRVYVLSNRLLILLPQKEKKKVLEHFEKFIFVEEVLFKDLERELNLFSVQGPLARKVISDLLGKPLQLSNYEHALFQIGEISLRIIGATHTGEEGFDILASPKDSSRFCGLLREKGKSYGIQEISEETLEVLRIEASIPRYGMEMDESTILLEAGLEHAVSFAKGCYLGQEVIARIKHIGHVNRQLSGLILSGSASKGDAVLYNEKEAGHVTSACYSPAVSSYVALAILRREITLPKTPVIVKTSGSLQQSTVASLPFYVRP